MNPARTIFAELTPPGRGGIAVLALFGADAAKAIATILRSRHSANGQMDQLVYGHILDEAGGTIDEAIVRGLGCDEYEIHCHGGPEAVAAICRRLTACGLEQAAWPEYLAARSGKPGLSPIALEGQLLLPHLATWRAAALVLAQSGGVLDETLMRVKKLLTAGNGRAEAQRLAADLLDAYEHTGRWIERPPRVAILGVPNAGKSSLMNCLVGSERVIVTEHPGTTRDVVTETVAFNGLPVVLADTAGLRDTTDLVEQVAIERARAETFRADVLVYLVDLSVPRTGAVEHELAARPPGSLVVGSKVDLLDEAQSGPPLAVDVATSAVTGQGVARLVELVLARLGFRWPEAHRAVPFTARQAEMIRGLA
jgi:tRNA modification GTPase